MYSASGTWQLMRQCLIDHYTDKEDEGTLIKELNSLSQRNDDIDTYFAKIASVVNRLNSWLANNTVAGTIAEVTQAKREWYLQLALTAFLTGLKEPLATIIRTKDPKTLQAARSYCLVEQNYHFRRNITVNDAYKKPVLPPKPAYNSYQYQKPVQPNLKYYYKPPIPVRAPQYFNHRPLTNFNNHFANNRGLPPKPPEPMDTTSVSKQHTYPTHSKPQQNQQRQFHQPYTPRYNFQSNGPSRFHAEELFNVEPEHTEYNDYYDPYPEDYYESQDTEYQNNYSNKPDNVPQIEIQDEDFRLDASENLTDT